VASPHPQTTDGVVVVLTEHDHTAKRMLSHPIQSLKHTWITVEQHFNFFDYIHKRCECSKGISISVGHMHCNH